MEGHGHHGRGISADRVRDEAQDRALLGDHAAAVLEDVQGGAAAGDVEHAAAVERDAVRDGSAGDVRERAVVEGRAADPAAVVDIKGPHFAERGVERGGPGVDRGGTSAYCDPAERVRREGDVFPGGVHVAAVFEEVRDDGGIRDIDDGAEIDRKAVDLRVVENEETPAGRYGDILRACARAERHGTVRADVHVVIRRAGRKNEPSSEVDVCAGSRRAGFEQDQAAVPDRGHHRGAAAGDIEFPHALDVRAGRRAAAGDVQPAVESERGVQICLARENRLGIVFHGEPADDVGGVLVDVRDLIADDLGLVPRGVDGLEVDRRVFGEDQSAGVVLPFARFPDPVERGRQLHVVIKLRRDRDVPVGRHNVVHPDVEDDRRDRVRPLAVAGDRHDQRFAVEGQRVVRPQERFGRAERDRAVLETGRVPDGDRLVERGSVAREDVFAVLQRRGDRERVIRMIVLVESDGVHEGFVVRRGPRQVEIERGSPEESARMACEPDPARDGAAAGDMEPEAVFHIQVPDHAAVVNVEIAALKLDAACDAAPADGHDAAQIDDGVGHDAAPVDDAGAPMAERCAFHDAAVGDVELARADRVADRGAAGHHVHGGLPADILPRHDTGMGEDFVLRTVIDLGDFIGVPDDGPRLDRAFALAGHPVDVRRRGAALNIQLAADDGDAGHEAAAGDAHVAAAPEGHVVRLRPAAHVDGRIPYGDVFQHAAGRDHGPAEEIDVLHIPAAEEVELSERIVVPGQADHGRAGMHRDDASGYHQSAERDRHERHVRAFLDSDGAAVFGDPHRRAAALDRGRAAGGDHDVLHRAAFGNLKQSVLDDLDMVGPAAGVDEEAGPRCDGHGAHGVGFIEDPVLRAAVVHVRLAVVERDDGVPFRCIIPFPRVEVQDRRAAAGDRQLAVHGDLDALQQAAAGDRDAAARGDIDLRRRSAVADPEAAAAVDPEIARRAAENRDFAAAFDLGLLRHAAFGEEEAAALGDTDVIRRAAAENMEFAVEAERDAGRRGVGVDRGGPSGKIHAGERVGPEFDVVPAPAENVHVSAVFEDVGRGCPAVDDERAQGIDLDAAREAAPAEPCRAAEVDLDLGRRGFFADLQHAAAPDGRAVDGLPAGDEDAPARVHGHAARGSGRFAPDFEIQVFVGKVQRPGLAE